MNVIEMSIKMEQEAVDFYTQCAEKTNNPVGKKMFLSIAEDEKHHIACAIHVQQKKEFSPAETRPMEDMKKIFEQNKEAMLQRVSSTTDELQALDMAMKMEQEAVDFYTKCAEKTNNPVGKKMFLSIVEDEKYHIACATKVQQGQEFKPAPMTPLQDMKKIFEQNKDSMLQRIASTTDELEALGIAMKMEEETTLPS